MFISRVPLNPRRRQARFLLSSPHAMHAAVLSSFPPGTVLDSDAGRVLWRVDQARDGGVWLIVVSPSEPELLHVAEQAGWPTQHLGESKPYGDFVARIGIGQEWAFTITANPVHTVTDDEGRKKKLGHVTAAQQISWFLAKAEAHGFEVATTAEGEPELELSDRATRTFSREGRPVTLNVATFVGRLRVTDQLRCQEALRHGIGRAKGYGCGLLLLSRLHR
ncbi:MULTISPECIES: type I-E CRISPR-associated protein Cas6/Cse3/CasE [unclassified Rathayibacter]|uniref:type I-E CRISPR-associated protein Cas6/Cse3/CasE n=1 Tax=unclassified Rathayibacter TaxID=2609250 RepID=UPI00188BF965|nr:MULTISPECIES: type I-E CRISPR-associated protein Cas6/Cse3/CasE [unclassified Rathayibacter]MBF4460963.1 type I-E CRISPR-associated protein Cas6/Cse3/CasE [Rathayibacter sp. VKM Ac-2879]MBF4502374.1 type I-E CRISPR-associated protein Cas6/Cse3/CasE [Rathayibacter sp. VKM Ac-2878]